MQTITAFRASDDRIFTSKAECEAHEQRLIWQIKLDGFFKDNNIQKNQQALAAKYIRLWEQSKEAAK